MSDIENTRNMKSAIERGHAAGLADFLRSGGSTDSRPSVPRAGPVHLSMMLAGHPANDLERLEIGQQLAPFLKPGENIDTGALRILADSIRANPPSPYRTTPPTQ